MKYKNSKDEREKIIRTFTDAEEEIRRRKKENTKLHDLKYGRFSKFFQGK